MEKPIKRIAIKDGQIEKIDLQFNDYEVIVYKGRVELHGNVTMLITHEEFQIIAGAIQEFKKAANYKHEMLTEGKMHSTLKPLQAPTTSQLIPSLAK